MCRIRSKTRNIQFWQQPSLLGCAVLYAEHLFSCEKLIFICQPFPGADLFQPPNRSISAPQVCIILALFRLFWLFWAAYKCLSKEGYQHKTTCHKRRFSRLVTFYLFWPHLNFFRKSFWRRACHSHEYRWKIVVATEGFDQAHQRTLSRQCGQNGQSPNRFVGIVHCWGYLPLQ
jgi:hypothetical protein